MKISTRIILVVFLAFLIGIFYWALFSPKEDVSERIYKTLQEQEKRADLSFKDVSFEEVEAGVKYWQLKARSAMVNKSTGIATLKESTGEFFKKGRSVLRFRSPAALWDMKKKEIFLDKPLGYDVNLERKINDLVAALKRSKYSVFNLPRLYKKDFGYWFQANNLSWKLADQKLICSGGIVLNKGEVTGYSDKLEGDVGLESVILQGDPKLVISPPNMTPVTLEAEVFEIISQENIIYARGNTKIFWEDARITSARLKYLQANEALELEGPVNILYLDIRAWGDSAKYLLADNKIVLTGAARAIQGENKLSGASVNVSLKDRKISVLGKGRVVITEEELK